VDSSLGPRVTSGRAKPPKLAVALAGSVDELPSESGYTPAGAVASGKGTKLLVVVSASIASDEPSSAASVGVEESSIVASGSDESFSAASVGVEKS
jgi:hypothetical protein